MPATQLAQRLSAGDIDGGKQAGGVVTFVIVAAECDLSGAHGQKRCGGVPRLNLALLVHAQNQGAVGRVEVEVDDVADFVDEQRVSAQLKGCAALKEISRATLLAN